MNKGIRANYLVRDGMGGFRRSRRRLLELRTIEKQISDVSDDYLYSNERWKNVPDFELEFMCSDYGRIISLDRHRVKRGFGSNFIGKLVKLHEDTDGYLGKTFCVSGRKKQWKVHRLVAFLFVPGWDCSLDVNHLDFNKKNNYYKNLNYLTKIENVRYSKEAGRMGNVVSLKKAHELNKKPVSQYTKEGVWVMDYPSISEAPFNRTNIGHCVNGKRKYCGGFIWKFKTV
jgi:hypothetical protein